MSHSEPRKLIQEQQILPVTLSAHDAKIGLAQGVADLEIEKIAQPQTMDRS